MEEIETLEVDIKNLKDAYDNVIQAMNNMLEIDGLDNEYKMLDNIAKAIVEERLKLERKLENLEEEAYEKENEEQWKAEQKEQEREYWESKF